MHVVAHEPRFWFLLEHEGALYLDVNGSHGAVGFEVLMRLTEEEAGRYRGGGPAYLSGLAESVQNGGPFAVHERNLILTGELAFELADAVSRARASGAVPPP